VYSCSTRAPGLSAVCSAGFPEPGRSACAAPADASVRFDAANSNNDDGLLGLGILGNDDNSDETDTDTSADINADIDADSNNSDDDASSASPGPRFALSGGIVVLH
jgi:hypothetical protein